MLENTGTGGALKVIGAWFVVSLFVGFANPIVSIGMLKMGGILIIIYLLLSILSHFFE